MAKLLQDPSRFFKKHLGKRSRVLLINPPVQERRYHWIRWNQPMDLLKLSSWLKQHDAVDIRLFDFMIPDERGSVPKHKVKETWTGTDDASQLWHFGKRFEDFEAALNRMLEVETWVPQMIVVGSLTSYWHVSIEKLLTKICQRLGPKHRKNVHLVLYGNYPRFEPAHAKANPDADIALAKTVKTREQRPDFELYLSDDGYLPNFFALDIEAASITDHLDYCLRLREQEQRRRAIAKAPILKLAFFNEDVCGASSQIDKVAKFAAARPAQVWIDGICGLLPSTLTTSKLQLLHHAGFRTLFLEHARRPGGATDHGAYSAIVDFLRADRRCRGQGEARTPWSDRGKVTAFVNIGLPDDDLDAIVASTLKLNSWFQGIIMKPQGYSPSIDQATAEQRHARWRQPCESSPQWFPYVGHGSKLSRTDYRNLVRWQNLLNKRVKGQTFDFIDTDSTVARLVRETLIAESWRPQRDST